MVTNGHFDILVRRIAGDSITFWQWLTAISVKHADRVHVQRGDIIQMPWRHFGRAGRREKTTEIWHSAREER